MRASTKPAIGAILSLLLISPWWGEASAPAADLREASSSTALSNAGTGGAAETYSNPVANDAAADFPDPSIIRGRDGYWYAYSTRTRLNPGGTPRNLPMMKSRDLVSWEYIGDVFDDSNRPSWFDAGSTTWGPSIEYIDGRYVMYFVGVDIPGHAKPNKSLGVATAPTPAGPWTDSGAPLIEPQFYQRPPQNELRHRSLIAPDGVQGADGRRYLYYGGFNGGIFGVPLNDNGTVVDGDAVQLVDDAHFEGPYVVRRKDWYYMFVSSNHCCTGGPVAGYTGWAVRSRNPLGPFKDHQGLPAKGTYPGGAPVSFANGNRFVSPGVNTLTTDLSGQDWMVYHAVDREHPYLEGPFQGGLQRGLYIDRLDWIDGWPTVREGQGPSEGPTTAPVSKASVLEDAFEGGQLSDQNWADPTGWQVESEPAGGYAHTDSAEGDRVLWSRASVSSDAVIRAAVRTAGEGSSGAAGLRLAADGSQAGTADLVLNAEERALEVTVDEPGKAPETVSRRLPASFDPSGFHEINAQLDGDELRVLVSDVVADHPVAEARVDIPADVTSGRVGLLARDTGADFDDVTVSRAATPHHDLDPGPEVGTRDPALSDEFSGNSLGAEWSWVREPGAEVRDGGLDFDVQAKNIMADKQDASLLLRDAPPADEEWTIETKVTLDLGETPLWGFPTAGLIAYANDDEWLMSGVHGRNIVRDARMIRETTYADQVVYSEGGAMTGPAGQPNTWVRLHHSVDPVTGEHELRGGSSLDGKNWIWGTTYTMPADVDFRIGLFAVGASADDAAFTARYDYLRVLRP